MHVLRLVLSMWLLITALLGGAALYGHAHPEPNTLRTLGFDLCNGKSCFFGIVPGATTVDDAYAILEQQGFHSAAISPRTYDGMYVDLQADPQADTVGNLFVEGPVYSPLPVSLGDVFGYFGVPCGFVVGGGVAVQLTLIYPFADVYVNLAQERISPNTSIKGVTIHSAMFWNSCGDSTPWPGFTLMQRYIDLHAK